MGELKPINPTKAQIIANPQAAARDYNTLSNKPQINGVALEGDKSSDELGLQGTITAEGYLSIDGGTLSFDDETFMVKRDALPKIYIRDAGQSGFTAISDDDVSGYTTGVIGQIPVATAGTFFRAHGGNVCTEIYQTFDWKLYARTYKLVGEHWLASFWREIGAQGNSITNAEIVDNNLIIHIGVLQPDGTILDTPVNVGRVVGENGAPGVSVTGATINQQGHLIITLSDGATIDAGYVGTPKTDIAGAVITLSKSTYTYDGTSKAPNVTSVTLNGQVLTAGTDYAVVANPATNAGQYVVTVNGIGDYTGTATTEWTITKAQATISGDDSITISGLDEPVSKTYTTNGDGEFSFAISGNVATVTNAGGIVTIIPTAYGAADLTVVVSEGQNYFGATKTVSVTVEEVQTQTVFGVVWDYSLSSPRLARLTPQTDPLGVVTNCPTTEPSICLGSTQGQSEFDNYLPWGGMVRKNYGIGELVDFTGYDNGETYVYIPPFWSKIVDNPEHSKMYFYISSEELTGFTKHPGSDRYVGRYQCDTNFESKPNGAPKTSFTLDEFKTGITAIDNNHQPYDIHTYSAICLLYLIELKTFNSQERVGPGFINSNYTSNMGSTDVLTYHTGNCNIRNGNEQIQYRWIEGLWGNAMELINGILVSNNEIYICNDITKYSSSLTADYEDIGLSLPTGADYITALHCFDNCYIFPKAISSGSSSTYVCDGLYNSSEETGARAIRVGGASWQQNYVGLFTFNSNYNTNINSLASSRPILIIPNGGNS